MIIRYGSLNIRLRLAILMSLLSIISIVVVASIVYFLWTSKIKTSVHEQLNNSASITVENVNRIITYKRQNLKAWAKLDLMVDILSEDVDLRIHNTLKLLKSNYNLEGDLIVVDQKGLNVAVTDGIEPSQKIGGFINNLKIVNGMSFLPTLNQNKRRILFVEPIVRPEVNTLPIGYLILSYPVHTFFSDIAKSLPSYQITDGNNVVQVTKINNETKSTSVTNFNRKAVDGKLSLNYLSTDWLQFKIDGFDKLKLRAFEERVKAFSPVYQTLWVIFRIAFIMVIIIIGIANLASKRFVAPIIKLQKFGQDVSSTGKLDLEIDIETKDEIGKLAAVLKNMMQNLKKSFEQNNQTNEELTELTLNLEKRVADRTEALSDTVEQLKQAQSQLVQSEKMSSLGQLVAGIAHELNNPISAIYTNIPILEEYFEELSKIIESVKTMPGIDLTQFEEVLASIEYDFISEDIDELLNGQRDSSERIRDIVLSLRNFSRLDEGELKSVNIHEGIDSTVNILRHEIKNRITIHRDYQLSKNVECFPGEINQIFMNILSNACQAIENEGNVWISTKVEKDNLATIIFEDDGGGISEENITKLFDPFFTTKPIGSGTGLGLSISYKIMEKHKGKITVKNGDKGGALFKLMIPLSQKRGKHE